MQGTQYKKTGNFRGCMRILKNWIKGRARIRVVKNRVEVA